MYFNIAQLIKHPFFEDFEIKEINGYLKRYRKPIFIYRKTVLGKQISRFLTYMPLGTTLYYAVKSNPNPELLKYVAINKLGCDTASYNEIKRVLAAGFPANKIIFTGPGKTERELIYAIKHSLKSINVESSSELVRVNSLAKRLKKVQDVMLRINPPYDAGEGFRIIGGSGTSKFGIDDEQIDEFLSLIKKLKYVRLKGIHIFNSSQILDDKRILKNTENVIKTAEELEIKSGVKFKTIDVGGGFGIPYLPEDRELNIQRLGFKMKGLMQRYKKFLKGKEVIFELGRFISGYSGIYLTRVLYSKISRGKNILITEGGIHHLLRPALIKQPFPIVNLSAILEGRNGIYKCYTVCGPLCTSLDELSPDAKLNETKEGDILCILNCGAYGYTESMPMFLSQTKSQEVVIN
ncbi:MAG: hypothetical protein ACP5P3_10545 [Ignavibacteria bacterium]